MNVYDQARLLANQVREQHGIDGAKLGIQHLRKIYKSEDIQVIYWNQRLKSIKGAYINDEYGITVMVVKSLPNDPKAFTLAHELKHHLLDKGACSTLEPGQNADEREVAAEVFAAELLFPRSLFISELENRGIIKGEDYSCDDLKRAIIAVKRETGTFLSYAGLQKTASFNGFDDKNELVKTRWKLLEESIYGKPYRRAKVFS